MKLGAFRQWKPVLTFIAAVILLYGASQLSHFLAGVMEFELRPTNEDMVHRIVTITAFLYAILLSLPFVPGTEVGIAMLVALGPPIAFLVYVCTVLGLFLAFIVGRFVPLRLLRATAERFHLIRLSRLLKEIEPLSQQERIRFLTGATPNRAVSTFVRHRHIGLAVLLSVPGNLLIGGGGGIGMIAGMSGLYSISGYLLTVMVAVSPVPIAVTMFGTGFLM